ncbi:MAG: MBL fold metallo-hydrolase [Desulfomonilia bacterium]|nr:MBL fold metallo-hydrolase [Desulfomonilia bacterium]
MYDFQKGSVRFIRGGRYPHSHTVVIDDERRALIDAASDKEKLLAFDRERPVDLLITSHAHEDHLLFNYLFAHARFLAHEADAESFGNSRTLVLQYAPSEEELPMWEEFLIRDCNFVPRYPDRLLKDGDLIDFGHTQAQVIHTPGHTPGHCAFHFLEEKILFLGDLDLVKAGPYYADVTSSLNDTIRSLERIRSIEVETYLTSHGKGIYDGDPAHIDRYLETISYREASLLEFLSTGPKTLDEIVARGIIYGPPKSIGAWDLSLSEKGMMIKHLERLTGSGRLLMENGRYHVIK